MFLGYTVLQLFCIYKFVLQVLLFRMLNMFCAFTLALSSSSSYYCYYYYYYYYYYCYYYYYSLVSNASFQLLPFLAPRFLQDTSLQ